MSLVIGFCRCKNCGWSNGKFNWHTYFKCPECGCREYEKGDGIIVRETKKGFGGAFGNGANDNSSSVRLPSK